VIYLPIIGIYQIKLESLDKDDETVR